MPPQTRQREAACPADQWLNFILNDTQHPGSMKWSLIIKLKSLSAEQFKWRQLSASLISLSLTLSLASSNLIENPHSLVLYGGTVLQFWRLIYPKNGILCVCEFEHVGASLFNYVCVRARVCGWVDVRICVLVEQAEPPPGIGLGRILTQTVCSNKTSTRKNCLRRYTCLCVCVCVY